MPLSKQKIKWIHSLNLKKFRDEEAVFVAEGKKLVTDLMPAFHCRLLLISDEVEKNPANVKLFSKADEIIQVTPDEVLKVSNQKSPQGILAVFSKNTADLNVRTLESNLVLALDDVQDPGNLGTIIRIADWFGISDIVCSLHCADAYGPKTVQATMGALARVKLHYVDLKEFILKLPKTVPVYGTLLSGENIYAEKLSKNGLIVMGNEGNGISSEVEKLLTHKLLIPTYPHADVSAGSESLNVGVATAIICAEFRRPK